jgi:ATP-dependent Zn protease
MSILPPEQSGILLSLARQASGKVGADIELAVREARAKARRERRPLAYTDLEDALASGEPKLTGAVRRRFAIHEAAHAVIFAALKLGTVLRISIDEPHGGVTTVRHDPNLDRTEAHFSDQLVYLMAGRAAEGVLLGSISAGSGSTPASDLDRATALAAMLEAAMGFGAEHPLLYHEREARHLRLIHDRDFAIRVHARIATAEQQANALVEKHRAGISHLADVLKRDGAIEAEWIASVLEGYAIASSP